VLQPAYHRHRLHAVVELVHHFGAVGVQEAAPGDRVSGLFPVLVVPGDRRCAVSCLLHQSPPQVRVFWCLMSVRALAIVAFVPGFGTIGAWLGWYRGLYYGLSRNASCRFLCFFIMFAAHVCFALCAAVGVPATCGVIVLIDSASRGWFGVEELLGCWGHVGRGCAHRCCGAPLLIVSMPRASCVWCGGWFAGRIDHSFCQLVDAWIQL